MFWNLVSAISTNAAPGNVIFWHFTCICGNLWCLSWLLQSRQSLCNADFTKSQIWYNEVTFQYTDFYSLFHSQRLQIQRDVIMQIFSNTLYFMTWFPDYFNIIWPQCSHWRGSNVEAVYRLAFANSTTTTTQANFSTVGLLKGLCSQWLSDKEGQKEPKWWMSSSGPLVTSNG